MQVVCVAPDDKVPHKASVLLLTRPYASNDGRVISKLLNVIQLRVVAEVRGVRVKSRGASTVSCGAHVLLTKVSDVLSFSLT